MKLSFAKVAGAVALAAVLSSASFADTAKPNTKAMAKPAAKLAALKCPYCGMMMQRKPSKGAPVAVKIPGKGTFYCCPTCHTAPKA